MSLIKALPEFNVNFTLTKLPSEWVGGGRARPSLELMLEVSYTKKQVSTLNDKKLNPLPCGSSY